MKTVVSNSMVAHLWASGTQNNARNTGESFRFSYGVLYSYRTPIARIVKTDAGLVVLTSREKYSPTTGKHRYQALRATRHLPQFTVYALGLPPEGKHRERSYVYGDATASLVAAHPVNLADYLADYVMTCATLQRRTSDLSYDQISDSLIECAGKPRGYAAMLGLASPVYETAADAKRIYAARNTPVRVKARAQRAEREALRIAQRAEGTRLARIQQASEDAADIRGWRAGEARRNGARHLSDEHGGALVRYSPSHPGTLETSWGVQGIDATKALALVRQFLGANDFTRHARLVGAGIGQFTVISATANWLKIGCHDFHVSELTRLDRCAAIDCRV